MAYVIGLVAGFLIGCVFGACANVVSCVLDNEKYDAPSSAGGPPCDGAQAG